ncbi:trypsin-like peptidase domain-containing protein [Bacillus sp. FJAT-27231]|uniref:trypsin-like peptidase domain-containing protein n=1 Tax=Bacillus sp. FJAT-27231 TaxID=1679168 RepID=UPI00069FF58E|nr:trypsin-like peptidase domain-containing protein [Bacillus sp. FJAT-27231]
MYCSRCGTNMGEHARFCPGCGSKKKKFSFVKLLFTLCLISIFAFAGVIAYMFYESDKPSQTAIAPVKVKNKEPAEAPKQPVIFPKNVTKKEQKALTEIIEETQKKVYTLFTDTGQGSGFLVNKKGDVVTNAHVVEGAHSLTIKDKNGNTHEGKIIGYSNTIDVAVVRVPDLAGQSPLSLEKSSKAKVGEEVIALGSPLSLENTATFGHITGVDRSFYIGDFSYDGVYQTSAAIAPGSSGGPLVSKVTGKVLAINSAKQMGQDAIGFSIPVKDVNNLVQGWIQNPLTEEEINALFYNENGELFYQEFWDEDAYFDGGEYNEEDGYEYEDVPDEPSAYEDDSSIDDSYGEYEEYEETDPSDTPYPDETYPDTSTEEDSAEPPSASEPADEVVDMNGDGVIDVSDLTTDINGDGILDENDLIAAGIMTESSEAY